MFRFGLFYLSLLCFIAPALGQWTIGPRADLALFRGSPRYIAYGIGASATYSPQKRNYWTADGAYHIPHVDHFIYVQGPRNLAIGDTTSSTWRINAHESHVSISLGFQRTFNHRQRSMEWYWKVASGFGIDRRRSEGELTYKYSGEQRHFDFSSHSTYIPLLAGGGRIWHLDHSDLALELSGMVPCYSITDREFGLMTRDYSLYLTFQYRWRV
ncbi:MAG: hypothetical protein IPL81_14215 [Flavobacteriales bacterium]|jgi:hypothetical protein|nr:hypothetical protein [Flavobacteriales bacterium]